MKDIIKFITENKNSLYNNKSNDDLIVELNLSKLENDTLGVLFNDYSIDWTKLNKDELYKLYNLLGTEELTFDEWLSTNDFI